MNLTLSLDQKVVKEARKIAVERDTTLTALVRDFREDLVPQNRFSGRMRREREALERSFGQVQFRIGKRTWKREDLYARS
ncbi:MAG: hypothetical protein DMG70_28965 [Acidobacteria bacterium]|nr:MAG: hypothetical protein DMG70_28965 [Acidobacteriota bacterium]